MVENEKHLACTFTHAIDDRTCINHLEMFYGGTLTYTKTIDVPYGIQCCSTLGATSMNCSFIPPDFQHESYH